MEIINVGTNEDGTPHVLYNAPGEHVVITPNDVTGSVTLADGSQINITDRVVVVESQAQAAEVIGAIAEQRQGATAEEAATIVADLLATDTEEQ